MLLDWMWREKIWNPELAVLFDLNKSQREHHLTLEKLSDLRLDINSTKLLLWKEDGIYVEKIPNTKIGLCVLCVVCKLKRYKRFKIQNRNIVNYLWSLCYRGSWNGTAKTTFEFIRMFYIIKAFRFSSATFVYSCAWV